MSYRVLVLPDRETMTPALLRKVRDLAAAGATVIGPRPRKSPSLSGFPDCDEEVVKLAAEIWGDCDGETMTEHALGAGRVVRATSKTRAAAQTASSRSGLSAIPPPASAPGGSVSPDQATWFVKAPPLDEPSQYGDFAVVMSVLGKMSVPPDFSSDVPLRWAHRRDGETEIYFVANPEPRAIEATALFRVQGRNPELWDPLDGTIRRLSGRSVSGGRTSISLRLEPHQSFFVVFHQADPGPSAAKVSGPGFPDPEEIGRLDGPWEVAFDPKWGGPEKIVFQALDDWSRRPEEGLRYYSGTAAYAKTFDLPISVARTAGRLWLDLGSVKNVAAVRLNGRDLGVVWCAPWRVDITDAVEPKANRLEIRVANLWPNRLIGDERAPADAEYSPGGSLARWPDWLFERRPRPSSGRFTFSTWKHYGADSPLRPSGLLGPVRILAAERLFKETRRVP